MLHFISCRQEETPTCWSLAKSMQQYEAVPAHQAPSGATESAWETASIKGKRRRRKPSQQQPQQQRRRVLPWKADSILPSEFDSTVESFSKHALGQHEDAHEFFHFVIDAAHTELERFRVQVAGSASLQPEDRGGRAALPIHCPPSQARLALVQVGKRYRRAIVRPRLRMS